MLLEVTPARPDSPADAPVTHRMGISYANATSCSNRFVLCDSVVYRPPESCSHVRGCWSCAGHDHALHGGSSAQRSRVAERSLETGERLIIEVIERRKSVQPSIRRAVF